MCENDEGMYGIGKLEYFVDSKTFNEIILPHLLREERYKIASLEGRLTLVTGKEPNEKGIRPLIISALPSVDYPEDVEVSFHNLDEGLIKKFDQVAGKI